MSSESHAHLRQGLVDERAMRVVRVVSADELRPAVEAKQQ